MRSERLELEEPLVLAWRLQRDPGGGGRARSAAWAGDALFLPQTRARFRALTNLGLTDAIRAVSDDAGLYTFWDYQAGAWQKNNGIRIDHLLLSPQAADRLVTAGIDKHVRAWEKPSDHVPAWIELDLRRGTLNASAVQFRWPLRPAAAEGRPRAPFRPRSPASTPHPRVRRSSHRPWRRSTSRPQPHQPERRLARDAGLALEQDAAEQRLGLVCPLLAAEYEPAARPGADP